MKKFTVAFYEDDLLNSYTVESFDNEKGARNRFKEAVQASFNSANPVKIVLKDGQASLSTFVINKPF